MAPIFILRIGWNCVILQPQCLSNRQRNGEAPRGTLESWFRTRTTGCASRSVMPTRGLASTPCLDLASCWNSQPQMQKRELAELLTRGGRGSADIPRREQRGEHLAALLGTRASPPAMLVRGRPRLRCEAVCNRREQTIIMARKAARKNTRKSLDA